MIGVCIVTYNQEQYIAHAIESVLMQEPCGHEVVAYVGNDCSTDRTGEICDEMAKRVNELGNERMSELGIASNRESLNANSLTPSFFIKVIHNKKNLGLVGNTMNLLDIMRKDGCEYIAMLDGDDYWSDPKKLQKQMAYFDAHPEYGLVHTCIDLLYPDKLVADKRTSMPEGDVSNCISNYSIGNCSVVFKAELLNLIDFEEFQHQGFMSCDYIMYVIFSCHTQFGFLSDHTAVWRRGIESVSGTADMEKQMRYEQNGVAMWRYAAKLYPDRWTANEQDIDNYLHFRYFTIAFRFGNRQRALAEAKLMSPEDKHKHRFKIMVAHSAILSAMWRMSKRMKELIN